MRSGARFACHITSNRAFAADTDAGLVTVTGPVTTGRSNMIQVLGSIIVLACVLGGFALEGGHLLALWHPTEILIIVGAALGAFMTSNPPKISKQAFAQALAIPKGPRYGRDEYVL